MGILDEPLIEIEEKEPVTCYLVFAGIVAICLLDSFIKHKESATYSLGFRLYIILSVTAFFIWIFKAIANWISNNHFQP